MLTSSSFFHIENRLGHFSSLSVPCLPSPQKNHILKRFKNIMVKESRRAKVRGKNWGVCVCFLEVCWFCLLTVSIFEALNQIWSHCFGVFFWHQTHISSRGILQQPKVFVLDETFFVSKILTGCCFMPPSLYFWGQTYYYIFHLICSLNKKLLTPDWHGEIGLSE